MDNRACQPKLIEAKRQDAARHMLQTVWNLSYIDVNMVEILYDRRPTLADWECKLLAVHFPWTWRQVRAVFPSSGEKSLEDMDDQDFFHA